MTVHKWPVFRAILGLVVITTTARAEEPIPHNQDKLPNAALSPSEAIRRMVVPPGFTVELVASEPDLVNPVAMTFDERGRVWVTESLEYPRRSSGPGRDRIKVLEDTDGDGKADKAVVFAQGLNIPSGIAVGHGGVWVANSPDILFLKDTDGDGVADKREVVVSGFGRSDTHELPNSLSWGPDGWLYFWNGVFNPGHVVYRGKTYDFTCAILRIHPKTRDFEVFCEGTSNPWGITWDIEGSAFASACVIDHLWHLCETGYYHRQGGPYPPFTWKIESIVDHDHQKAAYCGIHYYDSDAYPPRYRRRLYMGNIHGNCVNVDSLTRDGSTYRGAHEPDILTANDSWFMPVSQKTGPDGSLYILDWYDRYHCYQDANRDPAGIDRLKGRLYRVRYGETPRRAKFNLAERSTLDLVKMLASENGYDREIVRVLLAERSLSPGESSSLEGLALDKDASRRTRLNALWAKISSGPLDVAFHEKILSHDDPTFRAWGVRAAANQRDVNPRLREKIASLAKDDSPDVQLQIAIAARKISGMDATNVLLDVASASGEDSLIPHIVWQNLLPIIQFDRVGFVDAALKVPAPLAPALLAIFPRAVEPLLAERDGPSVAKLVEFILSHGDVESQRSTLEIVSTSLRSMARWPALKNDPREFLLPILKKLGERAGDLGLLCDVQLARAYCRDEQGLAEVEALFLSKSQDDDMRLRAFEALIDLRPADAAVRDVGRVFRDRQTKGSVDFRGKILASLGRANDARVGDLVLGLYAELEPVLKPRAIELLTQRPEWSLNLLRAIKSNAMPANVVNQNQVRKLLASRNATVVAAAKASLATVRETRNPQREQVLAEMRAFLRRTPGDPVAGARAFQQVCAQCHRIYGEGQDVGPDITSNGRGSYEQLLSNVFDPSLVIGIAFQGTTVATADGRILTGLIAEDGPRQVVLKLQGGKSESIPRGEIEDIKPSALSLMPEGLEKQLKPQEIADLFAYLTLDRPPEDRAGKPIPGSEALQRKGRDR